MAWVSKVWYDAPNPLTPLSAAAMNDLEARIGAAATQADAFNLQPACRVYNSAAIALTTGVAALLTFDTNRFDSDSQHYTSAAALTGTVAKTAAAASIVGTGTLFTSQLSIGQVIDIPGTAVERRVVTSIADDTHLTVNSNLANTATLQTATRVNTAIVARQAGAYSISVNVEFDSNPTGVRRLSLLKNSTAVIGSATQPPPAAAAARLDLSPAPYKLAQWDYVEVQAFQNSGGALNAAAAPEYSPEFGMFRVGAG